MVDAVDSIIHDLILQLVKSDKAYQDSGISRLLPIETVYKWPAPQKLYQVLS